MEWPYNFINSFCGENPDSDHIADLEASVDYVLAVGVKDRARNIIYAHYRDGQTYSQIGRDGGISGNRVRQIEYKALRKLRGSPKYSGMLRLGVDRYSRREYGEKETAAFRNAVENRVQKLTEQADSRAVPEAQPIRAIPEARPIDSVPEARSIGSVPEARLTRATPEARSIGSVPEAHRIEELNISASTLNILRRAGVKFIGDILKYDGRTDLQRLYGLGDKSIDLLLRALEDCGVNVDKLR